MPTEVKLPELGENIEKGDVVRVLVNVGDVIKPDQPIAELETDKATIEVPSPIGGAVAEIRVKPGDKVKVGAVLLIVTESREVKTRASDAKAPDVGGRPAETESKPSAPAQAAAPADAAAPAVAAAPAAAASEPKPAPRAAPVVDI
jgi:pyruvate dehydrogenase E2 component (dihydrolipoamide acetyltransferase)